MIPPEPFKPILCIDFDGVIHSYDRGWQDGVIYGTATPGFFRWAAEACKLFKLVVYSSRSSSPEGRTAMSEAIGKWSVDAIQAGEVPADYDWAELFGALEFSDKKPPAFLTIDDRAIQFRGDWTALDPKKLREYEVWNKPWSKEEEEAKEPERKRLRESEDMARAPYARRRVPWLLRMLGVPRHAYVGDRGWRDSFRTFYGEINLGVWRWALSVGCYEDAHLHLAVPGVQAFIRLPHRVTRWLSSGSCSIDNPGYGFSTFDGTLHLRWGQRLKIVNPPWGWNKRRRDYRREYLDELGEWQDYDRMPRSWDHPEAEALDRCRPAWFETYPYHYMLQPSGEVQSTTATVRRERRFDTYRIFGIAVRRRVRDEIAVDFADEMGSRRGSWKGGTVGCGYDMKPGETPGDTLRRMQATMRFDR